MLPGNRVIFPPPFDTGDTVLEIKTIQWCAYFFGLLRLDGIADSVQTASRGIDIAENWPAALELAADLAFRHQRSPKIEGAILQSALRRMPTVEMRKTAMQQLAEILKRPEYAQSPHWHSAPAGRMYFRDPF